MSTLESIWDQHTSAEAVTEATDRTIPGGTYRMDIVKKETQEASDASPWPGREMVRLQADCFAKNGDGEYHRLGRVFFDVSPQEMRRNDGKLDGPSRLWANFVAVIGRENSNREVLDAIGMFPVTGTVTKAYKTAEGYKYPKTEEAEKAARAEGGEPKNFVQSVRAFNG